MALVGYPGDPVRRRPGTAGHRRQDRHGVPVGHRGLQATEKAHVLVVEVDVDEPPQLAVLHQPVAQPGVPAVHVSDQAGEGLTRALHGLLPIRVAAQERRDPDLDGYLISPELGTAGSGGPLECATGAGRRGFRRQRAVSSAEAMTRTSSSLTWTSTIRNDRNDSRSGSAVETST